MIVYKKGDVLNSGEKYIVHGCNCKNAMGAGIARQIRERYPEAWKVDQQTLWGDKNKLGTYTFAKIGDVTIINAYIQYDYSRQRRCVDYSAVTNAFHKICEDFENKTEVLAMPKIGAGLGGGNWAVIEDILENVSNSFGMTFIVYEYENVGNWKW